MKSEWKASYNPAAGEKPYIVFRIKDTAEADHSGNREYGSDYMSDKAEAQAIANRLNGVIVPEDSIFNALKKRADYAINSENRDLVCETYGAAKMALSIGAISKEEFFELNEQLIVKGLNDPTHCRLD